MNRKVRLSSIGALILGTASLVACSQSDEPIRRGEGVSTRTTGGEGGAKSGGNATDSGATGGGSSSDPTGAGGSVGGRGGVAGAGADGNAAGGNGGTAGGGASAGNGGAGGTSNPGGGSGNGGSGGGGGGGTSGGKSGGSGDTGGAGGGSGGQSGGGGTSAGSGGSAGGPSDAGGTSDTLHFAVYGDTRTGSAMHQSVVDQIAKQNPQLVIHSGDLWDGYTPATFTSILTKNANIGNLLNTGLYVVSRGNHETVADFLAFRPSLARGNTTELFSYTAGNSFFVVLGMDPTKAAAFLEGELKKPEATAARWRFVQSHYPIYSGGTTHGARGIPTIEKLCDTYHVAVYWSGHDHIYERSHQVYGGQVVDTGDDLSATKGTVYVVSGGGGAPLYGVAPITTTHFQTSTNNYVDVLASPTTLTIKAYKVDGSAIDSYVISQ
jgi:hypothetical protein